MSKDNIQIFIEDVETGDIEERVASNFLTYRACDYFLRALLPTNYIYTTLSGGDKYGPGYVQVVSKWGLGHKHVTSGAPVWVKDLDTYSVGRSDPFIRGEDNPTKSGWTGQNFTCQSASYDRSIDYFPIQATVSGWYYTTVTTGSNYVVEKLVLEAGFKSTGITSVGTAASLSTITYSQAAVYSTIPSYGIGLPNDGSRYNANFEIRNPDTNGYMYTWTTSDVMFAWATLSSPITKSAANRVTLQWTVSFA